MLDTGQGIGGATARLARACLLGALGLALGCSSGGAGEPEPAAVAQADAPAPAPEPKPEPPAKQAPMRVLVTGFNDWRELGDPPQVWRCRDNPSCRLLVGEPSLERPSELRGPLVRRLERAGAGVEWRFATMPVTWGAFADVPDDVDVIINVGLGVYDRLDALQLEAGAFNLRTGADAAASSRPGPIADAAAPVLEPPADSPIHARLDALAGRRFAGYELLVAPARESNSYLCNETHYLALSALHRGHGRLREVYFLHIPYARDDDYEALAAGVAELVQALLELPERAESPESPESP